VVAYFKILTQNFSGVNVGNREKFTYWRFSKLESTKYATGLLLNTMATEHRSCKYIKMSRLLNNGLIYFNYV
jgi:hypothetical protein